MLDGNAETTMFAEVVVTIDSFAVVLADRPGGYRLLSRLALEAFSLACQRLEVVDWTGSTWGQASGRVVARGAFLLAHVWIIRPRLEGEHVLRAVGALLKATLWGSQSVRVPRALQARHQSSG